MLLTELFPIEILDIIMSFMRFRDYIPFMYITKSFRELLRLRNMTYDDLKWALTSHEYDGYVDYVYPCGKFMLSYLGTQTVIGMFGTKDHEIKGFIRNDFDYVMHYAVIHGNCEHVITNVADRSQRMLTQKISIDHVQPDGEVIQSDKHRSVFVDGIEIQACCGGVYCRGKINKLDKSHIVRNCTLNNILTFYNTDTKKITKMNMKLLYINGSTVVGYQEEMNGIIGMSKKIIKITGDNTELIYLNDKNIISNSTEKRYHLLISDTANITEVIDLLNLKIIHKFNSSKVYGLSALSQSETFVAIEWIDKGLEIYDILTWNLIKRVNLRSSEHVYECITHSHVIIREVWIEQNNGYNKTRLIPI